MNRTINSNGYQHGGTMMMPKQIDCTVVDSRPLGQSIRVVKENPTETSPRKSPYWSKMDRRQNNVNNTNRVFVNRAKNSSSRRSTDTNPNNPEYWRGWWIDYYA